MDLTALDNLLPTLRNRGSLVLAVRATRSAQRDLDDPHSTPWGEDRETSAREGVVSAYSTGVVIEARGEARLVVDRDELVARIEDALDDLASYWERHNGGLPTGYTVALYVARESDQAGEDNEALVAPIALVADLGSRGP